MVLHSLRVHEIIPSIRSKHFSFTAVTYQANIYVNRISTILCLIRIVVILKKQRNIIKDVMIYWSWCKNIFSYMNDIINDIIIRIKFLRIFEYLSKISNFKEEQSENFSFISKEISIFKKRWKHVSIEKFENSIFLENEIWKRENFIRILENLKFPCAQTSLNTILTGIILIFTCNFRVSRRYQYPCTGNLK